MNVHLDAQNISILHMHEHKLQTKPQRALATCPRSKYKAYLRLLDCDLLSNVDKAHMLRELKHFSGIQELHLTNLLFIYTLKNLIPVDVCSHHKATTYFEIICQSWKTVEDRPRNPELKQEICYKVGSKDTLTDAVSRP